MKKYLHVGCGHINNNRPKGFDPDQWIEVRFDIDESVKPDIVGTITDMSLVESGSMDAIFSSHNIEHVFPHEVPLALKECHRVLKEDGIVVITCPDLQSVCEAVANDRLIDPLYSSPAGPIAAIDVLYGHVQSIASGNSFMAHKGGFTYASLLANFAAAGFSRAAGFRRESAYDLWLVAFKGEILNDSIEKIASKYLPQ
jgi:SAM-dependent methyltransferase